MTDVPSRERAGHVDESDLRAAEQLTRVYQQMTQQLGRVIVGQNEVLKQVLIALFCLALYQPSVLNSGLNLHGDQPLAVVVVIDTSPGMGYAEGDKSHLEEACRRAIETSSPATALKPVIRTFPLVPR